MDKNVLIILCVYLTQADHILCNFFYVSIALNYFLCYDISEDNRHDISAIKEVLDMKIKVAFARLKAFIYKNCIAIAENLGFLFTSCK